MLLSIILFSSLAFSFILKGSYENIFIVLATMSFYKQVIVNKNYKSLIYGVLISFIGVNLVISFIFKDYIVIKEVQPVKEKEETLVLLVSEGENKNYNIKERSTQIYYEEGYKGMITGISNLYNYKSYYSKLGFSEFKHKAEEIAEKLRHSLGNGYRVVNSYMYSKPYFEYSVESIIEQGYKKIIICPLFMTEGTDYEVFMNRYEQLNLTSMNIADVEVLEPKDSIDTEWEILKAVNQERMAEGRNPLSLEKNLQMVADVRSKELQQYFSHDRPDGTEWLTVLDEVGARDKFSAMGENIASGYRNAEAVMEGWMNSDGHRANILNSRYNHIGNNFYLIKNYRLMILL